MDARSLVPAPHVARPLRLLPFRALSLTASRVGAPSSMRAFTRPYAQVTQRLERWEQRGDLLHDEHPAVYLHEYTVGSTRVRGLVGALDLSRRAASRREIAVFPHEGIHPEQAEELALRMTQMQINPAPILLVHRGSVTVRRLLDELSGGPPMRELSDRSGQHHRIWAIREPDRLALLDDELTNAQALIADGHHRYAAYLSMHRDDPRPATRAGLAMLVDQDDTPLVLGPIHRMFGHVALDQIRQGAEQAGVVYHDADERTALAALGPRTLVATDAERWATLELDLPTDRIAVEVLHDHLVPALPRTPTRIEHHHSVEAAVDAARAGAGTAVLLPAPEFSAVLASCAADRLLPEKATSFQPKASIGVLIRSLHDA